MPAGGIFSNFSSMWYCELQQKYFSYGILFLRFHTDVTYTISQEKRPEIGERGKTPEGLSFFLNDFNPKMLCKHAEL